MMFRQEPVELCRGRLAQGNFCRFRECEHLTPTQYSSSPLDYSLLPDQNVVAQFEQQSHHRREERGHDDERCENFAVFSPSLCPTNIPTKTRFHSYGLRNDQS